MIGIEGRKETSLKSTFDESTFGKLTSKILLIVSQEKDDRNYLSM
jgi:hypothetical protein